MDPYRVLFPIGTMAAILGVLPWVTFGFGLSTFYPGLFHVEMMIGGFLYAFSAGFLMTAIPQFTASAKCKTWELTLSAIMLLALVVTSFLEKSVGFYTVSFLSYVHLIIYCAKRFLSRTYEPPRFFIFVGLGLGMGLVGSLLLLLCECGALAKSDWLPFGKLIYTQGMALSLIMGVGSHLLPAIWGWSDLQVQTIRVGEIENPWSTLRLVAGLALLLLASFFIETRSNAQVAWCLRSGLMSFLAVTQWKILKKPKARGKVVFWLWISAWSLVIGLWVPVFLPAFWVHGVHLAFIGGFGLMTLMVGSRVILAHGGYGYRVELRSLLLKSSALLILSAALTRAFAIMMPNSYAHHLGYAAAMWVLAMVLWALEFIPRVIKIRE